MGLPEPSYADDPAELVSTVRSVAATLRTLAVVPRGTPDLNKALEELDAARATLEGSLATQFAALKAEYVARRLSDEQFVSAARALGYDVRRASPEDADHLLKRDESEFLSAEDSAAVIRWIDGGKQGPCPIASLDSIG